MGRIGQFIESIIFAIPRYIYRRIVAEEKARDTEKDELRAIRDALIEAQQMGTMSQGATPKWYATREACVHAVGLASAWPDPTLRELVRAYREAHDAVAANWTKGPPERWTTMREAFDRAMEQIAVLIDKA